MAQASRRAIVTGATRGLGWGMAEGLMEAGAKVVIWGSSEKVESVAEAFRARGFRCHGVTANPGVDSTFFSVVPNNSLGKSAVRMLRSNDIHCTQYPPCVDVLLCIEPYRLWKDELEPPGFSS